MSDNEILEAAGFTSADEVRYAVALVNAAKLLHPLGFLTADDVRACVIEFELIVAKAHRAMERNNTGYSPFVARATHTRNMPTGEPDLDDHEYAQYQNDNLTGYSHLMN